MSFSSDSSREIEPESATQISQKLKEKVNNELPGKGNGERGEVEDNGLRRNLKARHMQMIAIGGTLGANLFVGTGATLQAAGPAGSLIGYALVGIMVSFVMQSLGEMATLIPQSGSFIDYAGRFVDPALGFAVGWNYWFSWILMVSVNLSMTQVLVYYWPKSTIIPPMGWIGIILFALFVINCLGSEGYGETQYWFSLVTVLSIVAFIILGVVIASGGITNNTLGFTYWNDPGCFAAGVPGVINAFINGGFSFNGIELVGIAAGETSRPNTNVPKAIQNVFWRILFFYGATVFIIGLCVPYTSENLVGGFEPSASPFTTVFQLIGISTSTGLVNAIILLAVISSGNAGLYATSRTLMALARNNHAPKFFGRVNKSGVPIYALLFSTCCTLLGLLKFGNNTSVEAYSWLLRITTISIFMTWVIISLSHWRFRLAYRKQGFKESDLVFKSWSFPLAPLVGITMCTFIIFVNGYTAFWTPNYGKGFNSITFLTAYINIPIFIFFYVVWKIIKRTRIVPLATMDIITGRKCQKPEDLFQDEYSYAY